jgi:hypothetical protein
MTETTPHEETSDAPAEISPPELRKLRDNHGRFQPGVSGCPGGRSRAELEIRALAQSHCPTAIERLVQLTKSKNERVAVTACEALLNRGCGTPRQSIDLDASLVTRAAPAEAVEPVTLEEAARAYREMCQLVPGGER